MDNKTAAGHLELLVRRLTPCQTNLGKRLVNSPQVYVNHSGVLHALLSIGDKESLLSHPVLGDSWVGFVIENLLAAARGEAQGHFYRTSAGAGAEVDLLLAWPGGASWAIEIKRSLDPLPRRGFHVACADRKPSGASSSTLGRGIRAGGPGCRRPCSRHSPWGRDRSGRD